jgi:hypothetical protein
LTFFPIIAIISSTHLFFFDKELFNKKREGIILRVSPSS